MLQRKKQKHGYTLIEVLIVTAIIGLLLIVGIMNALSQLKKSRDAERKTDLEDIRVAFEGYYDENSVYPIDTEVLDDCGEAFQHYLKEIPCDPLDGTPYIYDPYPDGSAYRILARLENDEDQVIKELICDGDDGCGYTGQPNYNYGASVGRKVSDEDANPSDPPEPPVDPCENQVLQDHVCDNTNVCNSCGAASCPPGEIVYSCRNACVLSGCTSAQ